MQMIRAIIRPGMDLFCNIAKTAPSLIPGSIIVDLVIFAYTLVLM